ncbi:hypothetical protein A5641_04375 [Mycobacterium sp. 1554424.7]|nr:hypothetical protein A5641_04375 [Mycobacterium sp. 1554424.7]
MHLLAQFALARLDGGGCQLLAVGFPDAIGKGELIRPLLHVAPVTLRAPTLVLRIRLSVITVSNEPASPRVPYTSSRKSSEEPLRV